VLERRVVRRIGSTKERAVPARFVAATNRDLHEMSQSGRFRQDLYYRLNMMSVFMPPLRDRGHDIMLLAKSFAAQTARRYGLTSPQFTREAINTIQTYAWPGNVRELKHQVSRAMLLCHNGELTDVDLALPNSRLAESVPTALPDSQQSALDAAEKSILLQVLVDSKYNVSEAARKLGITRMTMRYRMDKHQIKA
jgi:DNA-binding NtrC family response regulator